MEFITVQEQIENEIIKHLTIKLEKDFKMISLENISPIRLYQETIEFLTSISSTIFKEMSTQDKENKITVKAYCDQRAWNLFEFLQVEIIRIQLFRD